MLIKIFEEFSSKKYVIVGKKPDSNTYKILCKYDPNLPNITSAKSMVIDDNRIQFFFRYDIR